MDRPRACPRRRGAAVLRFERDCEYRQVGLVYRDDARTVAASPDGIVEGRGPLELKCPMPKTHLLWLSDGELPREHVIQVQGQMWIMGADVGDFFSYCPSLPPLLISVVADIKLHDAFNEHIPAFCAELAERKRRLIDMGVEPWGVPPGQEGREREKPWWEDGSEPATGSAAPATKPERRATPVADVDAWLTEYDAAQGESHE